MRRNRFLKNVLGFGLLSAVGCRTETVEQKPASTPVSTKALREELIAAWVQSEKMTLTNVEQMPPELFTFRYTDEAMTFSEQWRHCIVFTCGQLAGRAGVTNPYEGAKLPVQMPKADVIKELKNLYAFVRKSIQTLSDEKLLANCDFAGDSIPVWRLFYAMENHIIHHRGQCIVYLRLMGIVPKGYYGW